MKTIIQKLAICPQQYEDFVWELYRNWCESVSINEVEFQQILANAAINRWFLLELQKCEIEFHNRTDRYVENVTPNDLLVCFKSCLLNLFNIRPMALLQQIKRSKTVKGLRVFNALNQN